jgi:hypothetical protein
MVVAEHAFVDLAAKAAHPALADALQEQVLFSDNHRDRHRQASWPVAPGIGRA